MRRLDAALDRPPYGGSTRQTRMVGRSVSPRQAGAREGAVNSPYGERTPDLPIALPWQVHFAPLIALGCTKSPYQNDGTLLSRFLRPACCKNTCQQPLGVFGLSQGVARFARFALGYVLSRFQRSF